MEEFAESISVVLYSAAVYKSLNTLEGFLQLSIDVLRNEIKRDFTISSSEIIELVSRQVDNARETGSEVLNRTINSIRLLIMARSQIQISEVAINGLYWQSGLAPYVWRWIHPCTRYLDRFGGEENKRNFVVLLQAIILCSQCQAHYIQNIPAINTSLQKTSLENIFLALHTHIARNPYSPFIYNADLIMNKYVADFSSFKHVRRA